MMKSDTKLMNELASSSDYLRPLTEEERIKLKHILLEIYTKVASICDKYNLDYMMGGGTCLGAVRHKGFIPWDDDLDLMMPRESYNKLIEYCRNGELGEDYEFSAPSKEQDSNNPFLKIYKRNTLYMELMHEKDPDPNGVFIDIFPIENAPKSSVIRIIKGYTSLILQIITTSTLYSEYKSEKYEEYMSLNKESYRRYKIRLIIGRICSFISHKKWLYWYDMFNRTTPKTGIMTIPTGRKHYLGEIHPESVFLPTVKGSFEGIVINLPADAETYLKQLYGDYMRIPPIGERERHFVYKFDVE